MYKTLLRTLSALSIVTITASAGFAEHPEHTLDLPCTDSANAHTENCRAKAGIKPVTTDVWKDSFESVPPTIGPNPTSRSDQFISPEASIDHYTNKERVNLKFDINNDGTNTIVGTSIFYMVNNGNVRNFYAGIQAGADLGAPLVEAFPEAVWKTRFKAVGSYNLGVDFQVNEIFDLTVKFISNSADPEAMGELSGYIQHTGYYGFKIDAQFNNAGVITGTDGITYGRFENAGAEPTDTIVGNLTGIIGERGALGAFHSNGNSNSIIRGFAGGFRANGYSEDELVTLRKCVLDPFHAQCNEDKFDDLKVARIKLCIEADNASDTNSIECHNAILKNNCIRDPFQDHCDAQLGDFYNKAQTERINFCRDNKSNLLCTEGRVAVIVACDGNHFSVNCANEPDSIRARIDFCADANNAGDPKCNHLLSTPNAARLSHSFNFEGLNTENRTNQFLQGTEAELTASKDGLTIEQPTDESSHEGSLNLAVLGRDASNGVSFFKGISGTSVFHYAGIFSSTDLGEPLTSTQPNAYWKGKFQVTGYLPSTDFTLEINFGDTGGAGNTDDGRVGRIQAFVRVRADRTEHFYVDGGFTDKGVITGDVTYAFFTNSNRKRPSSRKIKGEVRGLIGEKGAVAAFISNDAGHLGYAGGFVARQTTQLEKTGLDTTCAFNPFSDKCEFGFDAERDAEIARCRANREQEIADGYCDDIVQPIITDCEANPFAPKCVVLNSFKAKRADIVDHCANSANTDRTGCSNVTAIITNCKANPFGVYCDVPAFESERAILTADCVTNGNCDDVQRKPNAATWHSTANPFANVNAANVDGGFVRGTEDNLRGGNGLVPANVTKLNLSTATFGGSDKPLGGEAADGLAFGTDSRNKHYAGIFSGTDLGAPVAQTVGRASWVGRASFTRGGSVNSRNSEDFVLGVNFVDRKIEAYTSVFVIIGEFNDNGVIDGTAEDILANSQIRGSLSGLIGEEGAVGVFYKANAFSGGFVARPPNSAQMASLNATCANPDFAVQAYYGTRAQDPVYLANCHLNAVAEQDSLIKKCITGANAKTDECNLAAFTAVYVRAAVVTCIDNPFGTGCSEALGDNYDVARGNRNKFCNNFLNAEHEFCKDDNLALVCGYDPFNTICVGGAHYTKQEEICATDHGSVRCRPTVARICVGNSDIFNRVCGDDYNPARLGVCRNEYDNGPSERCTATVARICINDVFDDLCKHDAYFDNRVLACRDRDNDPRCTETITTACQRDLFHRFCNATHSDARRTRIELCNNLTGDAPEPNCMGDNLTNLCAYDPFNAVCPSSPSDDNKARAVKLLEMCANSAQADNLACISILKRPNAATLLQALPAETLVTTGESNQFLNATKTTDSGKSGLDGLQDAVHPQTFKLASGDARSLNLGVLGKDADDGVGYAAIEIARDTPNRGQRKFRHFAGIFSSTDLGAPLTQTNTKVGWKGKIQAIGYSLRSDDFTLEITFGNAGEGGKIEAFVFDSVNRYFHLKGDFDSKGLITKGTATFGEFANHDRNEEPSNKIEGKLRGLIGQDGAVGAFVSNADDKRSGFAGFSGGFVARPLTDGETTTLNNTCDTNPFHADCYFGFDTERNARLVLCQEDGRAAEAGCTSGANAIITDCKANPFRADCAWDAFDGARNMRVELCEQVSNASNPLCTGGASAAITGCRANPFSEDCTWDGFDDARNMRVTFCYDAVADDARCVGTAATIVTDCQANPFGVDCYFSAFKATRLDLLRACKDNTSDCTPSIKASMRTQPNAVTWANSFGDTPLPLTPDTDNPRNQFLQGRARIIDKGDLRGGYHVRPSLNLDTATFDGLELDGDYADGVALYAGANGKDYAGILSGTDLGAPLVETTTGMKFYGQFQVYEFSEYRGEYHRKDFTLDIKFNAGGTGGSVEALIYHKPGNQHQYLLLSGDFDDKGVISGTVDWEFDFSSVKFTLDTSVLTGLIGTEGALGVFIEENASSIGIYGGFVAVPKDVIPLDPNVKFSDWVRSFGNTPSLPTEVAERETERTRFLQGGRTDLDLYLDEDDNFNLLRPRPLILADIDIDVDGDEYWLDGVAYMSLDQRDRNSQTGRYETKKYHYAGILSGTNLGAVLDASVEANWRGELGMIVDGSLVAPREIDLTVDFDNKRISYSSAVNGAHFVDLSANWATGGNNDGALINGTITYNPGGALNDDTDIAGKLTGLIGQDGAVGVFRSTGTVDTPYAGGFVAVPSSVFSRIVRFSDWVSSFDVPPYRSVPHNETQQTRFLQDYREGLSRYYLNNAVRSANPLTLADVNSDGQRADGVAYASGTHRYGARNTYHVAGILSGTDLGAVLDASVEANWRGELGMIVDDSVVAPRVIDLTVNFDNKKISYSDAVNGAHFVDLSANWATGGSNDGVLTNGTITYNPGGALNDDTNIAGKVTGLIGQQGAVGVFRSTGTVDTPYAGGFVAVPSSVFSRTAEFSDWASSFDEPLRDFVPHNETQQTRFLRGRKTGLDNTYYLNNAVRPITPLTLADGNLGGKAADGVDYVSGTQGRNYNYETRSYETTTKHHYAGILYTTNLGAVLDASVAADWSGKLGMIVDGSVVALHDIDLTVDFNNSKLKIADFNISNTHFVSFVNGEGAGDGIKWDEHGVLDGKMNYRAASDGEDSEGTVKGLIGQEGAVGAFISNPDNPSSKVSYAGGFAAVPDTVFSQVVNFSDWVRSSGNTPHLPIFARSVSSNEIQLTQFLQATETGLDTGILREEHIKTVNPLTLADVNTDGERTDGVDYMSLIFLNSSNTDHAAGILSGTNLGAPLDMPVTAAWSGKLGMIVDTVKVAPRDITLNINFVRKGIEIAYTRAFGRHFVNFNNLTWDDNGVITGEMIYNPGAALNDATNSAGKVTGLIGQQGAVGAFISNGTGTIPYAGGFVAAPTQ